MDVCVCRILHLLPAATERQITSAPPLTHKPETTELTRRMNPFSFFKMFSPGPVQTKGLVNLLISYPIVVVLASFHYWLLLGVEKKNTRCPTLQATGMHSNWQHDLNQASITTVPVGFARSRILKSGFNHRIRSHAVSHQPCPWHRPRCYDLEGLVVQHQA
jgi:hypothetical protein